MHGQTLWNNYFFPWSLEKVGDDRQQSLLYLRDTFLIIQLSR